VVQIQLSHPKADSHSGLSADMFFDHWPTLGRNIACYKLVKSSVWYQFITVLYIAKSSLHILFSFLAFMDNITFAFHDLAAMLALIICVKPNH
jgi:hypothetical protein